jgi:hypothetical protein
MLLKLNIEEILEKNIASDEELLKKVTGKCGDFEREIDKKLNEENANLSEIFNRIKILSKRLLGDIWVEKNWYNIEKDMKRELDSQKR